MRIVVTGGSGKAGRWSVRDLRDHVLLCCTERNTGADVDAFVAALAECIA